MNFKGRSAVSLQLSTEACYRDFPSRAVPADVHGILMRVASLADTLTGKIRAWSEPTRRQSKRIKDLADIARLVEVLQMELERHRDEFSEAGGTNWAAAGDLGCIRDRLIDLLAGLRVVL